MFTLFIVELLINIFNFFILSKYIYHYKKQKLRIHKLNQNLSNLPSKTKIIIFDMNSKFDKKIYKLSKYFLNSPQKITHLTFGFNFNQKINDLPKNLTHLIFEYHFNQKVDKLPKNLTHLTFGFVFNQKITPFYKKMEHFIKMI